MMSHDVIVIGAGPAGSTAARHVAACGFKVLVLEKKKLDREKTCAGGISARVINEFGIPDEVLDREIHGDFICSPQSVTVALVKPHRIGACVMRGKFDRFLCTLAMNEGAEFREESEVIEPIVIHNRVVGVRTKENGHLQEYNARAVVVAEGSTGGLCKKLGVYVGDPRAIFLCYQQHMELSNARITERIGDNIELYFGKTIVPVGYAWIFPKDNVVSVGVGVPLSILREQKIILKERLAYFVAQHPVAREKLQGAKELFSQAALLPHGGLGRVDRKIVSRIHGNGYVIVGDAAGFASPATGEGIYYGMKSGKIAAEIVVNSLKNNDLSEQALAEYDKRVRQSIIYEDMRWGWMIRRLFLESDRSTERIVRAAKEDPWFGEMTRKLISAEIPYGSFLKGIYSHPHKLLKALLFY
jgi:geranylgeranyl reductase family protein